VVVDEGTVSTILSVAGSLPLSPLRKILVGLSVLRAVGVVEGSKLVDGLMLGTDVA
jgi:hypothetical protein